MRYILVDGYNVIRADARLQSFERVSLEQARMVLAQTLASSPRLANDDIVVVFDGTRGMRTHVHAYQLGRVRLLYSARGQTADDVIIAQARELAGDGRVVVVSNDVAVREQCRAAGCEVSGAENLLRQLPGGFVQRPDFDYEPETRTFSTEKRGNPRRSSRRQKRQRDVRF